MILNMNVLLLSSYMYLEVESANDNRIGSRSDIAGYHNNVLKTIS